MSGKIPSSKTEKLDKHHRPQDGKHRVKKAKPNGPRVMSHSELAAAAEATGGIYLEHKSVALPMLECAATLFKKLASDKNPDIIYLLGLSYMNGYGVKKNPLKAVIHFTRAAKLGHSGAQTNLGLSYIYGEGVEKNLEKAMKYLTKAADNSNPEAQYNLGYLYSQHPEFPNNLEQFAHYTKLAANQGLPGGQYNLGVCYEHGQGVERNLKQAQHYYELAAAQGYQNAIRALEIIRESWVK